MLEICRNATHGESGALLPQVLAQVSARPKVICASSRSCSSVRDWKLIPRRSPRLNVTSAGNMASSSLRNSDTLSGMPLGTSTPGGSTRPRPPCE